MRDIGTRIGRYQLTRYAPPKDPVRRKLRWFWLVLLGWIAWAGFLSDHSAYRLWRLSHEQHRTETAIQQVRLDLQNLERERRNPEVQRDRAEQMLRRSGMARPGEIVYRVRDGVPDTTAR